MLGLMASIILSLQAFLHQPSISLSRRIRLGTRMLQREYVCYIFRALLKYCNILLILSITGPVDATADLEDGVKLTDPLDATDDGVRLDTPQNEKPGDEWKLVEQESPVERSLLST